MQDAKRLKRLRLKTKNPENISGFFYQASISLTFALTIDSSSSINSRLSVINAFTVSRP